MLHFINRYYITLSSIKRVHNNSPLNLVVLHGLMGSKNNFKTITSSTLLTDHLNSVSLLDLRNHGESPHTKSMLLKDMADDLSEFIESMDNVVLLGHSLGGRVIFKYLSTHHNEAIKKVKGVVAVDILPTAVKSTYVFDLLQKLLKINLKDVTYNQLQQEIFNASQNLPIAQLLMTNFTTEIPLTRKDQPNNFQWRINLQGISDDFQANIYTDLTANWTGPHLVICGDKSQYVNKETVQSMKQVFPNFKEANFIHDCGHWVHAEKPKEFLKLVSQFIITLK